MALVAEAAHSLSAESPLHAEWAARNPQTPDEIAAFYRDAEHYAGDLDAWHATPERQSWTDILVSLARDTIKPRLVVDVGCGAGHDLFALADALPETRLYGVEPNVALQETMRERVSSSAHEDIRLTNDVAYAPIETANLVTLFDVLEHIYDPDTFLGQIAQRMQMGAALIETTATDDIKTPLHLEANQGWHPGHVLERHGFMLLDRQDRFAVWQRVATEAPPRATLMLCAYRECTIPTLTCMLNLAGIGGETLDPANHSVLQRMAEPHWRIRMKYGDALISRSRSIALSRWHVETADDVALMIDDDVVFTPDEAERIVALCRERRTLVGAAYPVGDCTHLAVRQFEDGSVEFRPDAEPVEVEYLATGFLAIHREVLDALAPTLPVCHADTPWAFRPYFEPMRAPMGGALAYLSEDWAFCQRARDAGFPMILDPTIRIGHLKSALMNVGNMHAFAAAMKG